MFVVFFKQCYSFACLFVLMLSFIFMYCLEDKYTELHGLHTFIFKYVACDSYILYFTANTLYFLRSSFEYVTSMKTSVCDYHLNDPTTLLHYQTPIYNVRLRVQTCIFRASRARGCDFSKLCLNSNSLKIAW